MKIKQILMVFLLLTIGDIFADESSWVWVSYVNNRTGMVFTNINTNETSGIYPEAAYTYSEQYQNIIVSANDENSPNYIIIQPMFNSQPKVWILIQRKFLFPFPNNYSDFQPNGDLYLVLEMEGDPKHELTPVKTETIPIDYSIFQKPVDKPTCYTIPEDHQMRLCDAHEAKLRTPALKVFLGE